MTERVPLTKYPFFIFIVHTDLKDKKIPKLIWYYSLPAIIGILANTLYNVVDRIFIGQEIGAYALSGLALTFPIMNILGAFGMLIGQGAAARISILLGKNDKDNANIIVFNALVLSFIFYVIISVFCLLFLDDILYMFGGTQNTIPYAKSYLKIIIIGHIFISLNFCLSNIIRSSGHPRIAMFTLLFGAILNVFLDYILIIVLKTGIEGAAYATTLSALISCIWVTHYFFKKNNTLHFGKKYFQFNTHAFLSIISIGLAPFLLQICSSVVNIIMNNTLLKYGGDLAIGAFGITTSYTTIVTMTIIGLSQGIQPILGYNYGAQQYDRIKHTLKICLIFATIITTIGWIIGMTMPRQIAMIFNSNNNELINITTHSIKIYTLCLFLVGFHIITTNYFQSIGKAWISILLSISRQVLLLIPFIYILPPIYGLDGAWMAQPVATGISFLIAVLALTIHFKILKNKG